MYESDPNLIQEISPGNAAELERQNHQFNQDPTRDVSNNAVDRATSPIQKVNKELDDQFQDSMVANI